MPNLLRTRWPVDHFLYHLSGLGVQSIFSPSETILPTLGLLQLSLSPNSTRFAVVAPDISSNLQPVATWTANSVAKLLEILGTESGSPGHNGVSDWLSVCVLGWVVRKSDIDRRRPCTLMIVAPTVLIEKKTKNPEYKNTIK